jgi:rhamnulokinase
LSLACRYRSVIELLERVTGQAVTLVHLVGGGSKNELLCRLTADIVGLPVLAGPQEAAAVGNVLVQLRAEDEFSSREEMRDCLARSFTPVVYEPASESAAYERFLALSGVEGLEAGSSSGEA